MKSGEQVIIKPGYVKTSGKKNTVIAKSGDVVTLFADHVEVWIVELKNKTRISIPTKFLK
jgi:hypothetical protein